ncbi:MAG: DEAD/DEAH box helicase [Eubacteriales bacterium]|nr:DEAD/DEAH box helicase [Eubacteriales bacterium]
MENKGKTGYYYRKKKKKPSAAALAKEAELRERAAKSAAEFDIECITDTEWEKLVQDALRRINISFSNDRFSLYGGRLHKGDEFRNRYYNDPVSQYNFDDFIDNLTANSRMLIDTVLDPDGLLLRYISGRLIKYNKELKEKAEEFNGSGRLIFAEAVYAVLSQTDIEEKLRARTEHYCTRKRIENLISRNQNYEEISRAARKRRGDDRRIDKHILESIPDNYIDLYPEAREIERHFILHIGPTNSGKTHDALEELRLAPSGVYLAPLRLLACEVRDRLIDLGTPCDLRTGEETELCEEARHMSSTIEMLDTSKYYDVAVIDEAQMIDDIQRGGAWTAAILGVKAAEIHVCMAEFAKDIVISLIEECSDSYEIVRHHRQTKLLFDNDPFIFPDYVSEGDALIVFSKRDVLSCAAVLQKRGINCSVVYGALPYDARKSEVERFTSGETSVIVATDAIGMGMNLPIRRVVFLRTIKFDGISTRFLYPQEIQQIAGRAGRYGLYDEGFFTSEYDKGRIRSLYRQKIEPIMNAPIGFQKSLIQIEGKLSEIMLRWSKIPDDGLYYKGDISEMLTLCEWMEQYTEDKELIFSFATIPFDIKKEQLMDIWQRLAMDRIEGRTAEYLRPFYDKNDLQSMETAFSICDLYYCYADRYDRDQRDVIREERRAISADIAEYLKTHELPVRKCRRCGRELAWNYPHQYCPKCIRQR